VSEKCSRRKVSIRVREMKVSIVIPTFNRGAILPEALESVMQQTYGNYEIIIVDDGSTDQTKEMLDDYLGGKKINYIYQSNKGVSAARNRGIQEATGEVISFLDSDDLWKRDKLETEIKYFSRNPEVDAIFSDLEKTDGENYFPSFMKKTMAFSNYIIDKQEFQIIDKRILYLCLLQEIPLKPSALSLKREVFSRNKPFDSKYKSGEDWELSLRLSKTEQFGYINRPLAILRISKDSLHLIEKESDASGIIQFLSDEKDMLEKARDDSAIKAAKNGLDNTYKHLAWHHLRSNNNKAMAKALLDGYFKTGNFGLLLRILKYLLPQG
jgi:glycosyltransferase involved in cell wall biosynthesis